MLTKKDYIPFGKPSFSDEEINAVTRTLRSGWVGMGPETITFEKELAEFLGVPYVVTVNSCTSALFLSLLVQGVGPGDEVICPSLTWCSTANAALYLGAKPVFCDVDPDTFCLTPELVKEKLTSKTKAVIVVHMGGLAVEMEKIRSTLPGHVVIIEDAAHALGSKFADGKSVGSSGNLTCFSFYANKNLSTGDGGAIALFDEELFERLGSLRQHALTADAWKRFSNPQSAFIQRLSELGYKMNYTDLQACIGRVQLRRQEEFHLIRLEIAKKYHEALGDSEPLVRFQRDVLHRYHSRHLFQILLPLEQMSLSRDEVFQELRVRNVGVSIHYSPLHRMDLYDGDKQPSLPNTEDIFRRVITLPISASMSLEDAGYVIEQLKDVMT